VELLQRLIEQDFLLQCSPVRKFSVCSTRSSSKCSGFDVQLVLSGCESRKFVTRIYESNPGLIGWICQRDLGPPSGLERCTSSREVENLSIDIDPSTSLKGKFICKLQPTSKGSDVSEVWEFLPLEAGLFAHEKGGGTRPKGLSCFVA